MANESGVKPERETYRPIYGQEGHGYAGLDIFLPGGFMPDDKRWLAFVGGCGVGGADTAERARVLLYQRALDYCNRHIIDAEKTAAHYKQQRDILGRDGLVRLGEQNDA